MGTFKLELRSWPKTRFTAKQFKNKGKNKILHCKRIEWLPNFRMDEFNQIQS